MATTMATLHLPTLLIALAVVTAVAMTLVLLAAHWAGARREGWMWALGSLGLSGGLALLTVGEHPSNTQVVLGYGVLSAGLGLTVGGFRTYAGLGRAWLPVLLLGVLGLAGAALFAYAEPSAMARQRWTALLTLGGCGWTGLWLWGLPEAPARTAQRLTAAGYLLTTLMIGLWLADPLLRVAVWSGPPMAALLMLMSQLVTLGGQMLMLTQRHAGELTLAATTDALTGIHNRAGFEELATRKIARAGQTQQPLALLVFDIDHFKRINDTHGHPVGDRVLRRVVSRALNTLRPDDLLGRWGGEEFVALLVGVSSEQAVQAAERLRVAVVERGFKLSNGTRLSVSVSIGLMATPAQADDPRTQLRKLVAVADMALYEAKRGGRNQVQVGHAETRPPPLGDAQVSAWVAGATG
jgi:diguanylate cyclase (GGDEF)-like protein